MWKQGLPLYLREVSDMVSRTVDGVLIIQTHSSAFNFERNSMFVLFSPLRLEHPEVLNFLKDAVGHTGGKKKSIK